MGETAFIVSCQGVIDDASRQRISLEFGPTGWTGGMLAPGQPFPSVATRFQFRVEAGSEEEAIARVREIVAAAGAHVDDFEAAPAERE